MRTERALSDLDVAVGPHPARRDWRVLRVNFNGNDAEQKARVGEAIRALYAPRTAPAASRLASDEGGADE
jgi:hypothetical protein